MQSMHLYININLYQNNTKYIVQGDPTKKRVDIFYCKQWVAKLLISAFFAVIHKLFLETLILAYVIINKNTDCHFGSELWNNTICRNYSSVLHKT